MSADFVAFCPLVIKSVNDDLRQIAGIASTSEVDRDGEIMDVASATFKSEIPLMWQHEWKMPAIGTAKLFKDGDRTIRFTAQIAKLAEASPLKDRVDMAWQAMKSGLVKFVSIGGIGGSRQYNKDGTVSLLGMEIVELSGVTIPANASASIQTVKAIYGSNSGGVVRLIDPARIPENLNGAVRLIRS